MADKLTEARMAGMNQAYNIAKEYGIEELKKEIQRRNITHVPVHYTKTQIQQVWDRLSKSMYNNMLTVFLYTLNWNYGFGPKRLKEFVKAYHVNAQYVVDLDYLGEHYVKMEDYAREINEKCKVDLIDLATVIDDEITMDAKNEDMNLCRLAGVIWNLRRNGFEAAAEHLEKAKGMLEDKHDKRR